MLRINSKTLLYFSTARRARRAAAIGFTDTTIRRPPVFCQYKTRVKREFAPRTAPLVLLRVCLTQIFMRSANSKLRRERISPQKFYSFCESAASIKTICGVSVPCRAAAIGFSDTTVCRPPVFCQYKTRVKREFAPRIVPLVLLRVCLTQIFMQSANSNLGGDTALLKSSIRFVKARHRLEPSAVFPYRGNNFCRPCRGYRVCHPS